LKLYTVKEVAKILKLNKNKVYENISEGKIKSVRLGDGIAPPIRITHDDLISFINRGR
jgi:excisionase family DNA binding protein